MKGVFNLLFCCVISGQLIAQTEGVIEETPPPSANELLEVCTESEHLILEEQLTDKDLFEQNTQSTGELLQLELDQIQALDLPADPSEIGIGGAGASPTPLFKIKRDENFKLATYWDASEVRRRALIGPSQFDSRIEVNELSPLISWQRKILDNSRSVGVVIHRDRLSDLTDSIYALDISTHLKTVFKLCPEEPYGAQVSLGVGTAFIIGMDTMMTAGHVFEGSIEDYVILFNFEIINRGGAIFPIVYQRNVYEIEEIISEDTQLDITSFRVNKPLQAAPLKLATQNTLSRNQSIYMIGHPSGLPKKVALNASIYTNDELFHFYTTLDAFQGNSGSPVFDMETHTVIGVLVSGLQDYQWTGSCNKSNVCFIPYCKGEKVMRMEQILNE